MKKKKLPLHLHKEPTLLTENGKSIITFEYFNVKKYRYEVFKINRTFPAGGTTDVETQRKKVYTALKRGYSPDLDLIKGEFITHRIKLDKINKIADISWFDLILCEIRNWCADTCRLEVGGIVGFILACESLQLISIIRLLTKTIFLFKIEVLVFPGIFIMSAIYFDIVMKKRIEKNYHEHYSHLPTYLKNYVARIIILIGIEAVIGAFYFYAKVFKMVA